MYLADRSTTEYEKIKVYKEAVASGKESKTLTCLEHCFLHLTAT